MDFELLTYSDLSKRHPEHEQWRMRWEDYRLIYKGGEEFLRVAGQSIGSDRRSAASSTGETFSSNTGNQRPRRFLWQLEGEPDNAYLSRLERAFYVGYVGPIIDYFRHYLFSHAPEIRPAIDVEDDEADDPPDWWALFDADANGGGKSFMEFMRDVSLDVLVCKRAGWLIGHQETVVPGREALEGVHLLPFTASEILDWQKDCAGNLDWVVLSKKEMRREFPGDRVEVETLHYLDRTSHATWEVQKNGDLTDVVLLDTQDHGLGEVPFIWLEIPDGLWPANKLASWQLDLFNQSQVLARGQLLSCFIQPALTSNDPNAQSRVFGEGVLLNLRAGDGAGTPAETFAWTAASVDPLKFVSDSLKEKRDEGYRIVHQMSLAVDAQNATAVARSGTSKVEDRKATEVILAGYGSYVREAIVRTLNLLSRVFGDKTLWTCAGFDSFQVSSLDEELQIAALAQSMGIPSPTFEKRMHSKIAKRLLDHADEATIQQVNEEIEDAVDQKTEGAMAPAAPMGPPAEVPAKGPNETPEAQATQETASTAPIKPPPQKY